MARRSLFDFVGLKAKLLLCIFKTDIILKAGAFILTERSLETYAQRPARSVTLRRAGDIKGDSAWQITNQWNDKYVTEYRTSLNKQIQKYIADGKEFTCEDLALSLLIDYASANGLPVTIQNGSGTYDARSDNYTDMATFKNDVLTTTGANDLQNGQNTTQISISNSKTGDIILNRYNDNNIGRHVQVISGVSYIGDTDNVNLVTITQGNSDWLNKIPGSSGILNAGNPNSSFYTGTKLEKGSYDINSNVYMNQTTSNIYNKYSSVRNIVTRRWNFKKF